MTMVLASALGVRHRPALSVLVLGNHCANSPQAHTMLAHSIQYLYIVQGKW